MKLFSAMYPSYYPFDEMELFSDYAAAMKPEELEEGGCLVVWGGGDISPSLYKKEVSKYTGASAILSHRDYVEWNLMKRAKELEMPIIGICRGAQMLCALAGGFLIQDVTNHTRSHAVETEDGKKFIVSSLHHQMLCPFEVDHKLIAWSANRLSDHYMDVNESVEMATEPEFVWFPQNKGIAIQWHPEFMPVSSHANEYVKKSIEKLVFNKE
jgi:putative glutamine amidotransferase